MEHILVHLELLEVMELRERLEQVRLELLVWMEHQELLV
jgi:hypothetical protein